MRRKFCTLSGWFVGRANGDTGVGALGAHSEGGLRHDGGGRHGDEKFRHGHREANRQGRVRHRASDVMSGVTSGERPRRTAWSVVLLLAMAYRGHLQQEVNMAEMAEIGRTEAPHPEPLAEAGSELTRVGYAVEGMLEIGTPVPVLAQERPMLVVGVDRALPEGGAGLSEAHVLSYNYVGELEPVQCNSELVAVADSGGAAIRTVRKRRRKEKLESYWYCQYCKKYNERAVDLEKCRACGVPIQGPGASVAEAERKRLQSREKRLKGRELNSAGAGLAAVVERGSSGIFDEETRREAVVAETRGLQRAIGNPRTLASEDQKMAIIDGFLLVHYKGAHSLSSVLA